MNNAIRFVSAWLGNAVATCYRQLEAGLPCLLVVLRCDRNHRISFVGLINLVKRKTYISWAAIDLPSINLNSMRSMNKVNLTATLVFVGKYF